MQTAFQPSAFQQNAFQIQATTATKVGAFQCGAFQANAFQVPEGCTGGTSPIPPASEWILRARRRNRR